MSGVLLWLPESCTTFKKPIPSEPITLQIPQPVKESKQISLPSNDAQAIFQAALQGLPKGCTTYQLIEVHTQEGWANVLQEIEQAGICGLDLETTGLDPLSSRPRLCQLAIPNGTVYVADLWKLGLPSSMEDLGRLSERSDIKKVGHNLKFDLLFIQASSKHRLRICNIFDTMLASQVNWAGLYRLEKASKATKNPWKTVQPEQSLKALSARHFGLILAKEYQVSDWGMEILSTEQIAYAGLDAAVLLPLHDVLQELLQKNNLGNIAELEFKALPSVVEIELQGLPLDAKACSTMKREKEALALAIEHKLQVEAQEAGFKPRPKKGKKYSSLINPASSLDVLDYLQAQGHKITSTKEEDLKELAGAGSSFAQDLLLHRRLSRQVKFLEDWLNNLSPIDGRLHPGYFQLSTRAGRFSSSKPNAQQIPKRGEDGQAIRKLFKAPQGKKIVKADFSGIELRIMACLSHDKTMIDAFQSGQDLHKLTASRLAGVPLDQVTKAQRQSAKSANFGLIYGVSASGFRRNAKNEYGIDMTEEKAEQIRNTFFVTYPGVAVFHQQQKALKNHPKTHFLHSKESGFKSSALVCTFTKTGRKRVWGWKNGRTLARDTELYNSPSQGTGADLLKAVMAEVYSSLPEDVKLIGSVHDELILEAPDTRAQEIAYRLREIMRKVGSEMLYPVPVDAEVEILDSWGG
jgi:DNA polymerase-1